jgi:NTP pyrophosphatase (non-canonical NTP hydrolase)
MTIQEYSDNAIKSWLKSGDDFKDLTHLVAALAEEAGESCSILKRHCRGDFDFFESKEEQRKMLKELGDQLWYINAIAVMLGSSLQEVMEWNNHKTLTRLEEGKIKGRGDDR